MAEQSYSGYSSRSRSSARQQARDVAKFEDELKKAREGTASKPRNREEEQKKYELADAKTRAELDIQRANQGLPPMEAKKPGLRDLRQDPNRESFADTEKRKRQEATQSGAFGSKAKNLEDRKALFEEMKKGGDAAQLREKARGLGVGDKGWDIAQARLAKGRETPVKVMATEGGTDIAVNPKAARDMESQKVFGTERVGTAGNYLNDFESAAREADMPDAITPDSMAAKDRFKQLEKNVAASSVGVDAAAAQTAEVQKAGALDLAAKRKQLEEAKASRDATIARVESSRAADAKTTAQIAGQREQQSMVQAARDKATSQATSMATTAVGLSNPITAPLVIGKSIYDKVTDKGTPQPKATPAATPNRLAEARSQLDKLTEEGKQREARLASLKDERALARAKATLEPQFAKEKAMEEEARRKQTTMR